MDLEHEFSVTRSVTEAWGVLSDLERIAPCVPGAHLEGVEDDAYGGVAPVVARLAPPVLVALALMLLMPRRMGSTPGPR